MEPIKHQEIVLAREYENQETYRQILKLICELSIVFNEKHNRIRKSRLKKYQELKDYFMENDIYQEELIQGCFLFLEIYHTPKLCQHLKLKQIIIKCQPLKSVSIHSPNSAFQVVRPEPRKILKDLILTLYKKKLILK